MLGHHLLTVYRTLSRHWPYAAINLLGLAVGVAAFLVLWLDVGFERSFERFIPHADQVYAVRMTWMFPGRAAESHEWTMGGLLDQLKADFGPLSGTRIWTAPGTIRSQNRATTESFSVVDVDFFKTLDLPIAGNNAKNILVSPDSMVLSPEAAARYFGVEDPIGRKLEVSLQGRLRQYRVVGVLSSHRPASDLKLDFIVSLTPQMTAAEPYWYHWGSASAQTFLRFPDAAQAKALNAQLDAFTDRRGRHDLGRPDGHANIRLRLVPLLSVHLIEPYQKAAVATLGLVGLLTLGLAAVNYVNLATARADLRAREVAVRKVLGATAGALRAQFLIESTLTAAAATLLGLALTELAVPLVDAAGGLTLRLHYTGEQSVLPLLASATALIGLGAGAYPALVLSRFKAAAVLASARAPGGGRASRRLREALVGAQFAVAIGFTAVAAVILSQSRYLHAADLGFRREGVIIVTSFDNPDVTDAQRSTLLGLWRALPHVANVTEADIAPGVDEASDATSSKRPGALGDGVNTTYVEVGPDFFTTYGVRPIAGRLLDRGHGFDDMAPIFDARDREARAPIETRPANVVLNASAAKALGFRDAHEAVGQTFLSALASDAMRPLTIAGVVADFRMRTPRAPVPSTYYLQRTDHIDAAAAGVRFEGGDPAPIIAALAAVWRRVAPGVPFAAKTAQASLQDYYRSDDQRSQLFILGALLAVAIGCVGLYGLAAFDTRRRSVEIGIRKVLGASTGDVVRLLVLQFLRPVMLANIAAWPIAYLAARSWLSGFNQRIALAPQYFLGATALTLVIAVATVAGQAWRVARATPATALYDA